MERNDEKQVAVAEELMLEQRWSLAQPFLLELRNSEVDERLVQAAEAVVRMIKDYDSQVIVSNFGMVKAGKSSLCNALLGRKEFFATGVVRTTAEAKRAEAGNFWLCDTPGIHAKEEDTEKALAAYEQSDIVLFVHNAVDGELIKQEVRALQQLIEKNSDPETFWERFVFVLTNADQKDEEELETIARIMKEQIYKRWNYRLPVIFCVDSHTYFRGLEKNEAILVGNSGIERVKEEVLRQVEAIKEQKQALFEKKLAQKKRDFYACAAEYIDMLTNQQEPKREEEAQWLKRSEALNSCSGLLEKKKQELKSALAKRENAPLERFYPDYDSLGFHYSSSYEFSSEYSAEQAARQQYEKQFWNKFHPSLDRAKRSMREYYGQYDQYIAQKGLFYYDSVQFVTLVLSELNEEVAALLQGQGFSRLPKAATLFTVEKEKASSPFFSIAGVMNSQISDNRADPPELCIKKVDKGYESDFSRELYYHHGFDWYLKANVNIDDTETYVGESWFGNPKYKTLYKYDIYDARRELQDQMDENIKNAEWYIRSAYSDVCADFIRQLDACVERRLAQMREELVQLQSEAKQQLGALRAKEDEGQAAVEQLRDLIGRMEQI